MRVSLESPHPAYDQLADLVESRLPQPEREVVQGHVDGCRVCAAEVAWLQRTVDLMRTDDSVDAPAHVVNRALRFFRRRPEAAAEPPRQGLLDGLRKRLRAALQFDSGELRPAMGLRGAATAGARQLLYRAADHEIEVRVSASGEQWVVAGQVLGPELPAVHEGSVALEGPAGEVEARLNELSEFALPPVPAGTYTLRLHLPHADVEVEGLILPPL